MQRQFTRASIWILSVAVILCVASATAYAAWTKNWTRVASGGGAPASGLVQFPTDVDLLANAGPQLATLRVSIDGTSYPWRTLDATPNALAQAWTPAERVSGGLSNGEAVAEFRIAESNTRYDAAQLEIEFDQASSDEPFVATATLEGSSDQKTWYEFARGSIYTIDVAAENDVSRAESNMVIGFAPTEYQYLRVSVPGANDITGMSINSDAQSAAVGANRSAKQGNSVTIPSVDTETSDDPAESILTFDSNGKSVPLDFVEIVTTQASFERDYIVRTAATRDALDSATPVMSGLVYRKASTLQGVPGEQTKIDLSMLDPHERFVQVRIANGSDAPLAGLQGTLSIDAPIILVQVPEGSAQAKVTYGRSDRSAPEYEFARLPLPDAASEAPSWKLSKAAAKRIEVNKAEETRRRMVNLAVLAFGVIVIGLAVFVLRRSKR